MSARLSTFVLLGLAGLVSGCGLIAEPLDPGPQNRCTVDDDCGADRCELELGMCVAVAPDGYRYYLEIVTPADPETGTSASATLGPFETGADTSEVPLALPVPVRVEGAVVRGGEPVSAQLTFVPRDRALVTNPSRFRTSTLDPMAAGWTPDAHFALEVDPETDYDVLVEPIGDARSALPPLRAMLSVADAGQRISIVYDDADLVTLVGDVHDPAGAPATGLTVRAIDSATGARISSVATLAPDALRQGEFRITMFGPPPAGWLLRIAPEADRLYPTYLIDPAVLTALEDPLTGEQRAQVLVPGAMAPVSYAGTVEYPEALGDARPVPGAVLTLRSSTLVDEDTGMVGSVETRLVADDAGRFDGMILPGDYEVTVVPVDDAALGVLVEERMLAEGASPGILGHIYRVPVRTILGGVAQAPGGEPLAGARVGASALGVPLEGIPFPDVARRNRSNESFVGSMGEFRLPLDIGLYDVVVEPTARSGYPWWIEPGVGIGGASATLSRVYEMRAPVVFMGTLTDAGGAGIEGAEVRAFGELSTGRLLPIGRATTGEDGVLRLLLPPEL